MRNICTKYDKTRVEVVFTCSHDIIYKNDSNSSYECLICKGYIGDKIPDGTAIAIDLFKNINLLHEINEVFRDIVYSDKDSISTFNDFIDSMQYENNIKVYRKKL